IPSPSSVEITKIRSNANYRSIASSLQSKLIFNRLECSQVSQAMKVLKEKTKISLNHMSARPLYCAHTDSYLSHQCQFLINEKEREICQPPYHT
ncbi:hypothetical protein ACTXT7_013661, partial [Hymenolepis weldensis]